MSGWGSICCALLLTSAAFGQCPVDAEKAPTIQAVQILDSSIPAADLNKIEQSFVGKPLPQAEEFRQLVLDALQDLGYFKAEVSEPDVHSVQDHSQPGVIAGFSVREGQQYRIAKIQFASRNVVLSIEKMRSFFPEKPGDLFNVSVLREGLRNLNFAFSEQGYVNAVSVPRIDANDQSATLAITFEIDPGKQFTIRAPHVIGGTSEQRLQIANEVHGLESHFWTPEIIARLQKLGVCPERQIKISKSEQEETVDLVIDLDTRCSAPECN